MKIERVLKKNKILFIVSGIYILMFLFMRDQAVSSIDNSMYYVIEMLQIIPVVFVLTSLIEAWVPKKVIMDSFGEKAGPKGIIFSFLLGSLSAGPIYAAFPVCKMLLKKGASVMNIVIILSAWAVIKVPMLANEAKFLGIQFMGMRWILTVISITVMGFVVAKIIGDGSQILAKTESEDVSQFISNKGNIVFINETGCIGCGICTRIAPMNFELKNRKATFIKGSFKEEYKKDIEDAVEKCPVNVIKYIL